MALPSAEPRSTQTCAHLNTAMGAGTNTVLPIGRCLKGGNRLAMQLLRVSEWVDICSLAMQLLCVSELIRPLETLCMSPWRRL
eukprot:5604838-Amphidinium_carterae.1